MDTAEQEIEANKHELITSLEVLRKKWEPLALENAKPIDPTTLEQPRPDVKSELIKLRIIELLDQRNSQRDKIFNLAKWYCWASFAFLVTIVFIQILGRVIGPHHHFSIFSGSELQILVTGVFVQFVGLLYIITKSLYDDTNYKEIFKDVLNK